jgi:hypothetical protein
LSDLDVDRPGRTRQYKSTQKHHHTSTNNRANKWKDRVLEKNTFDAADYGNFTQKLGDKSWEDSNNNLWGVLKDYPFVGTEKEQFGFFPSTSNSIDRWHGYPVIPFIKGYEIEDALLKRWVIEGVIDEDDIPTLKKRKRI